MAMIRHTDEPSSPAWHARRARSFNAGDASAALGCHPSGKTRTELLHELHTGIAREFSDYVQERVIDPGHRVEALWRPIAEEILGEDLQVYAASLDVGLSRPLGASLDGATFMDDVLGECKSVNDALREALPHTGRDSHERNDARRLPKGYRVQLEQQQQVTGATRTLFSACRFNEDGSVAEERHCFYSSDPELRAEILATWRQIDADLATYQPPAASAVEKIVAEPIEALPAVFVKVEGALTVSENFGEFQRRLTHFLDHRLIREPKTDQDFVNLDAQIKEMKAAEEALQRAEAQMLAQIQTVDQAKKTKDMLAKLVRDNRLMAEKLLASEKERRRGEIVAAGVKALADHVAGLNKRLGKPYMPQIPADFGGCIKGMKSLAGMEDKVATELARAKIAANEVADRIDTNCKALDAHAEHALLFADERQLVLKAPDDYRAVITARIAEHRAAEERRLEAERARIRAEEEARARAQAEREQQQRDQEAAEANAMALSEFEGIRQQVMIATLGRAGVRKGGTIECIRETLAETEKWEISAERFGVLTGAAQATKDKAVADIRQLLANAEARAQAPAATPPAANVHPLPTRAPAPQTHPTLMLRDVQKHLAPFTVTAEGLRQLGFEPSGRQGAAVMYHDDELPYILTAAIQHLQKARDQLARAA